MDILAWLLEKLHALRNAIMNFMNILKNYCDDSKDAGYYWGNNTTNNNWPNNNTYL